MSTDKDSSLLDIDTDISIQELEYLETKYRLEQAECESNSEKCSDAKFLYAWGLVRSAYADDQQAGIQLLSEIMAGNPDRRRECLYYIAVGQTRLGKYSEAQRTLDTLLVDEPMNSQASSLKEHVEDQINQDGTIGMLVMGGLAALAAGIGVALFRSRRYKND